MFTKYKIIFCFVCGIYGYASKRLIWGFFFGLSDTVFPCLLESCGFWVQYLYWSFLVISAYAYRDSGDDCCDGAYCCPKVYFPCFEFLFEEVKPGCDRFPDFVSFVKFGDCLVESCFCCAG